MSRITPAVISQSPVTGSTHVPPKAPPPRVHQTMPWAGHRHADSDPQTDVINLPLAPPTAPMVDVNPADIIAYEAMMREINEVLGALPEPDPQLLTPPSGAAEDVVAQGFAALFAGYSNMTSNQTLLAFMRLRLTGQSDNLEVQNALTELTSTLRQRSLDKQRVFNQQAEDHMQAALAEASRLKYLQSGMAALATVLTVALCICTCGLLGGAIVMAAAVVGFFMGGFGVTESHAFDIHKALGGASFAANIVMLCVTVGAAVTVIAQWGTTAAEGAAAAVIRENIMKNLMQSATPVRALQLGTTSLLALSHIIGAIMQNAMSQELTAGADDAMFAKTLAHLAEMMQQSWESIVNFVKMLSESHRDAAQSVINMLQLQNQSMNRAQRALVGG